MLLCRVCNFQLIDGSAFCSKCGASVGVAPLTLSGRKYEKWKAKDKNTKLVVIISAIVTSVLLLGLLAIISLPGILAANRVSNQRHTIGALRILISDQENYKADYGIYATIEKLALSNKIDLRASKKGYVFIDLIKTPNADFFAILASPKIWGKNGDYHYVITSEGAVMECREKNLPFDLALPANQSSISIINKLNKAH